MNAVYSILNFFETYAALIPILVFFIKRPAKVRWIFIVLVYSILYIPLSAYANFLQSSVKNNTLIYVLITGLTFICFSFIMQNFIQEKKFKIVTLLLIILFIIFSFINVIWGEGDAIFNSHSAALAGFISIIYCIYYYKIQLENLQSIFIEEQPSFWIVTGIFIYSAGNFFIFSFYNSLIITHEQFSDYVWYVDDVLILIMNFFFAKAILKCNPKQWILRG